MHVQGRTSVITELSVSSILVFAVASPDLAGTTAKRDWHHVPAYLHELMPQI